MGEGRPGRIGKAPHATAPVSWIQHQAERKTKFFLLTEKVYFSDVLATEHVHFN